jgi:hypothetical protein
MNTKNYVQTKSHLMSKFVKGTNNSSKNNFPTKECLQLDQMHLLLSQAQLDPQLNSQALSKTLQSI